MTTGGVWYPTELADTMFQLLFNSFDTRQSMVFKDLKETEVCFGSTLTMYAVHGCRKKFTETMLHSWFNSHNNKCSMIFNPEALLHLLFNCYNNRQSMVFYTRNKAHAPAVVQLSLQQAKCYSPKTIKYMLQLLY